MSNATLQVGGGNWAAQDGKLLGYAVEPTSGRYLAREFTVNRNSSKWVLGSDGYLYEVPADQPALEYYSDGTFRGALVEPQSVNLCLYSEAINPTGTPWSTIGATPEASTVATPDGDTSSKIIKLIDSGIGTGSVASRQVITLSQNTKYTASVFLRADQKSFASIIGKSIDTLTDGYQYFELSGAGSTGTASNLDDSDIKAYPNGWYRCSITFTTGADPSGFQIRVLIADSITNSNLTRDGSNSIFVWGAQLEESPIATSYIPTTTGAVTRLKDDIFFTNASSVIGHSEGTLFVEVDWQNDTVSQGLLDINDGLTDNRVMIFNSGGSSAKMYIRGGGSGTFSQGVSSTSFTGIKKLAFTYEKSATATLKLFIDGTLVSTGTNQDTSAVTGLDEVIIGGQPTGSGLSEANMWIRDARIYNTRLSEINCVSLTGGDDPYAPIDGNEFTWNGYNYKVIVKNGLAWLDRNLGATRAATSSTDSQAYGDLYQWGRLTDGHEKRNSGTTLTLSTTDVPGNDDFIKINTSPNDWRSPQNNNLWQGVNGINNPAPPGWRIPTELEWDTERQSWSSNNSAGAFASSLKFTKGGFRDNVDGSLDLVGNRMAYWTSTVVGTNSKGVYGGDSISIPSWRRALGFSVRCVRDIP